MGLKDKSLSSKIGRIAIAAASYHVWVQRNNRTHKGRYLTGEQMVKSKSWGLYIGQDVFQG
jgi:hypothetical protein